ncbi:MAG: hypothetical protein L3J04_08095 [Robiginitomaculum sp.]|nr:hypothetical protein [Robiginitomaculum sp.]
MSMYDFLDKFPIRAQKLLRGFYLFSYGLLVVLTLIMAVMSLSIFYGFVFLMSCVITLSYYAGERLFEPPRKDDKINLKLTMLILLGLAWFLFLILAIQVVNAVLLDQLNNYFQ